MPRTRRLLTLLAAVFIVAALVVWQVGRRGPGSSDAVPAATTAVPAASSAAPSVTRTVSSAPSVATSSPTSPRRRASAGASTTSQCRTSVAFVPTKFSITRLNVAVPVVPVDEQSSKGTMAPPLDQPWEVAWIDTTNKPGSRAPGVVNLTAHTYHAGGAIGNSLYATNPLRAGDLIVLSDGSGHSACYRYTRQVKFDATNYASDSTVFYDQQATPQVRLMICWDYNRGTRDWDSRVVFYADPVSS